MKRTPIYSPHTKPARDGIYETGGHRDDRPFVKCHWHNGAWHWINPVSGGVSFPCVLQERFWRDLTEEQV